MPWRGDTTAAGAYARQLAQEAMYEISWLLDRNEARAVDAQNRALARIEASYMQAARHIFKWSLPW